MELPKLKIGHIIFNELLLNKSININLYIKMQYNIYGECCNHLVPISINPLLTPFSLAINIPFLFKIISECNLLSIVKEDDRLAIKCDRMDHDLITIPINEIEVINYEYPQVSSADVHEKMNILLANNFPALVLIMNVVSIFLTLLDHNEILVLRRLIHKLKKDLIINDNELVQYILSNLGLGSGSTPSSDDFIIGLLTSRFKEVDMKLVNVISKASTTPLSKKLINEILLNPCYIINLCKILISIIIKNDNLDKIIDNIIRFIRVGGFSGIFMLAGLITGISLNNEKLLDKWRIILNKYLDI